MWFEPSARYLSARCFVRMSSPSQITAATETIRNLVASDIEVGRPASPASEGLLQSSDACCLDFNSLGCPGDGLEPRLGDR